jgi:adenylate cyclase, class 2
MPDQPEIEVKFIVADPEALRQTLARVGAVFEGKHSENNIRLDNAEKGLAAQRIVVRVRHFADDKGQHSVLTIKTALTDSPHGLSGRREIETGVADGDAMIAGLGVLGLAPTFRYEKRREVYRYGGLEIDLDELPYGWFVELEGHPKDIHGVVDALGFDRREGITISYAQIFENVKQAMGLAMDDLTFEAFEGVRVDAVVMRGK